MTTGENKRIVQRAFEAFMAGDLRPLGDLLAPDAVLHQCGFLDPLPARRLLEGGPPGPSRIREREVRLDRMVGEGDLVALQWRTSGRFPDAGTHEGKEVSFPSMTFIRLEHDRIAEIWNIQDTATLQMQLEGPS